MLPSQRYQQLLLEKGLKADALQLAALQRLDALHERLQQPTTWFQRSKSVQGIYLWGQVGIGKSFLTDLFFECLPAIGKTRQHYQHFMARIHKELNAMTGRANPLTHIGKKLAQEYKVICLDELYITDMGDAMIVYHLFESLFNEGVALLITSNFAPDFLYKDDLKPAVFKPAIKLIKQHCEELHLASTHDYRRMQQHDHRTWFVRDEMEFAALFDQLNAEKQQSTHYSSAALEIQQHKLQPQRFHQQLVWFNFHELCEKARSAKDYLALGQRFKTILVSGVPQFGASEQAPVSTVGTEDDTAGGQSRHYSNSENAQRRFISLVDECYDQGIKLYLQGDVPLPELYAGGRLAFEFQRTLSRLVEMQSAMYRDRHLRSS